MKIKRNKVSDEIALFLKSKKIKHVFGIIGSANANIFDSISKLNYTEIVCVHHEQAATMAMQNYYRTTGKISAALVTAGGASSNAITGVISAWADSIPGIIISGQENLRFIKSYKNMRMWGIQGFDSTHMVSKVTKYSKRLINPKDILFELEKNYQISTQGRPGPTWLDIPIDVQGTTIPNTNKLKTFKSKKIIKSNLKKSELTKISKMIENSKRPVFWFGNGIKLSKPKKIVEKILKKYPFPSFVSWAAIDLLKSNHHLNYGRPGVYGNRASNLILQNADLIISVGTRMSIPMIGYVHNEFARKAKIIQVDIDKNEIKKLKKKINLAINNDANIFFENILGNIKNNINEKSLNLWVNYCKKTIKKYPHIELKAHSDNNGFINSYKFLDKFSNYFRKNECIVTDMGTALLSGHQVLKIKDKQTLMTSTGLGEMGFGLPGAIGASFGKNKGEIICLNCDGGMMMNIQELQTIDHYKLPIKIFVFNNDGYLMIKHTQKNLFSGRYSAVNKKTGVSCPDFKKVAAAFNMKYYLIKSWKDFNLQIPKILKEKRAIICDVIMDPEQFFYPKLSTAITKEGKIISPPLEDLSPLLSRSKLKDSMIIPIHKKSKNLN
jgi:acetolactate synthase I/II/III large subunit